MNNRVLNVNDIENSIEIFGNEFELEFSENYINKLRSVDIKRIEENNVFEQLKELMNLILNDKEAYNKISKSYEVARDDSCNVIINFYEIENYVISKAEVNGKLVVDQQETDKQLVAQNKNSLHKYVGGRTDMEVDTQFNTMKFSNTSTVAKNVQVQFATGYTSWINGKKIRLKIIQHIDTDLEEQSTDNEGENNS